jgi:hypothetical protein
VLQQIIAKRLAEAGLPPLHRRRRAELRDEAQKGRKTPNRKKGRRGSSCSSDSMDDGEKTVAPVEQCKGHHCSHEEAMEKAKNELEAEDIYVDIPIDGLLLKRNFDYILLDKEDIQEYTGKPVTKINQTLRVPYHGTLQLASHLISQMYRDSSVDSSGDVERILVIEP